MLAKKVSKFRLHSATQEILDFRLFVMTQYLEIESFLCLLINCTGGFRKIQQFILSEGEAGIEISGAQNER